MSTNLHPGVRLVLESATPDLALRTAREIAGSPPPDFDDAAWLTVAAGANSAAIAEPLWFAVSVFAHEQRSGARAAVDALVKRARLISTCGTDSADPFRSTEAFFEAARVLLAGTSAVDALRAFQGTLETMFAAHQSTKERANVRDDFLRGRRFREVGRALRAVADCGVQIPEDLAPWLKWASLREVDGKVIA